MGGICIGTSEGLSRCGPGRPCRRAKSLLHIFTGSDCLNTHFLCTSLTWKPKKNAVGRSPPGCYPRVPRLNIAKYLKGSNSHSTGASVFRARSYSHLAPSRSSLSTLYSFKMPDWMSTAEIVKDAGIFVKLLHALLGLYVYEWFLSLDFEWDFITGKKRFRWPMIFYFANRYLLLFALIGIIISFDVTAELDCQTLYTFNQLAGDAAIGLASINLSIRTIAIWSENRYVVGLLVLIILGHWSLILQGVQLTVRWVDGACQIVATNNKILSAIFIYSMCFDLLVLLLNAYKLFGKKSHAMGRSRLVQLIFADGLIFFFIAFVANMIATIFMVVALNPIMTVIFNVPAAVASTIVACRAVRRLTNFTNSGAEVYGTSSSGGRAMGAAAMTAGRGTTSIQYKTTTRPGVHVQMETFTAREDIDHYPKQRETREESDTDIEDVERKGEL